MNSKSKNETIKILIAGEGGQGVQAIGKILSETGFEAGLSVSFIPNYGVEQRGGVTIAFIQFRKNREIIYPKFLEADIIVWLSQRSIKRTEQYLYNKSLVIYNSKFIANLKNPKYIRINFDQLANDIGSHRSTNMIVLGFLLQHLKTWIDIKYAKKIINHKFAKYYKINPNLKKQNDKALDIGYNLKM